MNKINLAYVKNVLGEKDLAMCLFPTNKHPQPALKRCIDEDTPLNEIQIARLALMLQIGAADLMNNSFKKLPSYVVKFDYLGFRVHLNSKTLFASIVSIKSDAYSAFVGEKNTPMRELFDHIEQLQNA